MYTDTLFLRCNDDKPAYPYQFLLIFFLDVVSAFVDLAIFFITPKIENNRKRLKEAR